MRKRKEVKYVRKTGGISILNKFDIFNKTYDKTCYFDIDGVLNAYPDTWVDFLNLHSDKTGIKHIPDLKTAKDTLSYSLYRELKYEYRESGYKKTLAVNPDGVTVTNRLKKDGWHIIIITSRPIDKHPSLFKQTIEWLQENKIPFGDVIFSEKKYAEVLLRYPNLGFGVDDHRGYANLVSSWGYKMFLLNNKYNQGDTVENVIRIDSLNEILSFV